MGATTSRIDNLGQVTIPEEIRHQLGLEEGDSVEFLIEGTRTLKITASPKPNRFDRFIGIALLPASVKNSVEWVRSLRDEEID